LRQAREEHCPWRVARARGASLYICKRRNHSAVSSTWGKAGVMEGYEPSFLSIELQPKLEAGAYAREAIRSAFRELPEHALMEILTVVSELVTNAVQHGPGKPIRLQVGFDPEEAVIRGGVTDQGDPSQSIPRIREVTVNKGGGYGLRIVDAMTSEWAVVEGSTSVRFQIPIAD
jgi:anti-sigma regulatory factor (Ser/Thr protein kinase)